VTRATCAACRSPLLWALTVNGKLLPLDPDPDPDGNQAAYRDGTGGWRTRQLKAGEEPFGYERRFMPHMATCKPQGAAVVPLKLPQNVVPISAARSLRSGPRNPAGRPGPNQRR
jgi:hypothetical protein